MSSRHHPRIPYGYSLGRNPRTGVWRMTFPDGSFVRMPGKTYSQCIARAWEHRKADLDAGERIHSEEQDTHDESLDAIFAQHRHEAGDRTGA